MPENLRITAPVGSDGKVTRPNSTPETPRTQPVNPGRVPQAGGQKTDGGQRELLLARDSVFGAFIRRWEQTPGLGETLQRLASMAAAGPQAPGRTLPADAPPLQRLAAALTMERGDIVKNLVFQQENGTLFSGPLFRYLDRLSGRADDPQLDLRIADFLRAFTGCFSAGEVRQSILNNLRAVEASIPAVYARKLQAAQEKLPPEDASPGAFAEAVKKEILPLLSRYVARTNDYGKSRDAISLLINNLAILETGSRKDLVARFEELLRYCRTGLNLPEEEAGRMQGLFAQEVLSRQAEPENEFSRALASLLSRAGRRGEGESEGLDPAAVRDICTSVLLDHSVFMPFVHLFLPASVGGRFLFTEIWIEKKDAEAPPAPRGEAGVRPVRLYLTFDIQDLGYFEASVSLTGKRADLHLACPPALACRRGEIRADLAGILQRDGLAPGSVRLTSCREPEVPKIIRKKIDERKRAIDVSV